MKFLSPAIFALLFQFAFLSGFSQQVESLHSVKAGISSATYSYEQALGKQFTINMEAGASWSWHYSNKNTEITFSPIFQVEPRIYYNVKKRFDRGHFLNNSASFFSLNSGFTFATDNQSHCLFIVPKWGFRRAMGKHLIFETQIGSGMYFYRNSSQFAPGLDIKFGYVF